MKRPFGVVFSAILLLLGSLFQLLMAALMAFSGAFLPMQAKSGVQASAPMPPWMPYVMYAMSAFFLALAAWGILTAVGLFRLRRWARYSVLIIGGGLAVIGLLSCLTTLLLLAVPLPVPPSVDASQAPTVQAFTRIMIAVIAFFYGAICAVGVSWLIYFNRKKVCEVFAGAPIAGSRSEIAISPTPSAVSQTQLQGSAAHPLASPRPLLISVLAVLNLIGAGMCVLMAPLPIPGAFLGLVLHGWPKTALYLAFAVLQVAIGVGLWRLKEWGRLLALVMIVLGVAQCILYSLRPSLLLKYTVEINRFLVPSQPPLPEQFQTMLYRGSFGFSVLFCIAIAAVLVHYRIAFQQPVTLPQNQPTTPL